MTRRPTATGALALPLAITAGFLALAADAARGRAPGSARVELEVAGMLPMADGASSILVLREKGARVIVPVIVSSAAARELSRTLAAHERRGVLGDAIQKLGARVREVEIAEAEETPGAAVIRLAQGGRELELAARPSESVALAVASGAPIVTTRKVMDESGLSPDDLAKARDRIAGEGKRGLRL